ncbi:hypothetical protein [Azospirillum halopraeferens]|uniref:hypothetical protein n=1 Tax=Azospirillum halopraeferens TaxID=34010 RepID=UPI000412E9F4|nr:hypothetical protein [Azospirillum halopraeferens]
MDTPSADPADAERRLMGELRRLEDRVARHLRGTAAPPAERLALIDDLLDLRGRLLAEHGAVGARLRRTAAAGAAAVVYGRTGSLRR